MDNTEILIRIDELRKKRTAEQIYKDLKDSGSEEINEMSLDNFKKKLSETKKKKGLNRNFLLLVEIARCYNWSLDEIAFGKSQDRMFAKLTEIERKIDNLPQTRVPQKKVESNKTTHIIYTRLLDFYRIMPLRNTTEQLQNARRYIQIYTQKLIHIFLFQTKELTVTEGKIQLKNGPIGDLIIQETELSRLEEEFNHSDMILPRHTHVIPENPHFITEQTFKTIGEIMSQKKIDDPDGIQGYYYLIPFYNEIFIDQTRKIDSKNPMKRERYIYRIGELSDQRNSIDREMKRIAAFFNIERIKRLYALYRWNLGTNLEEKMIIVSLIAVFMLLRIYESITKVSNKKLESISAFTKQLNSIQSLVENSLKEIPDSTNIAGNRIVNFQTVQSGLDDIIFAFSEILNPLISSRISFETELERLKEENNDFGMGINRITEKHGFSNFLEENLPILDSIIQSLNTTESTDKETTPVPRISDPDESELTLGDLLNQDNGLEQDSDSSAENKFNDNDPFGAFSDLK